MERRALHQLERSRVDLAVVEVDLLVELHLFPLCNLQNNTEERRTSKELPISTRHESRITARLPLGPPKP